MAATAEDLWTGLRLWFSFTGQAAGTSAPNSPVTIHCDETNQDFVFTLSANSIARPAVAAMLVLDQSGSMNDQAAYPARFALSEADIANAPEVPPVPGTIK